MRGQSTHLREVRGGGWIGPPLSRDRWALISLGGGADALGMRTSGKGSRSEKRRQVFQAGRKQCCEDFLLDLRGGGGGGYMLFPPPTRNCGSPWRAGVTMTRTRGPALDIAPKGERDSSQALLAPRMETLWALCRERVL